MEPELRFNIDPEEIVNLRREAFDCAYDKDQVNLSGLDWNWTDGKSNHLGVYIDKKLVSCLRVSVLTGQELFFSTTQFQVPNGESPPFILLARAATLSPFLNHGFHTLLRLRALELSYHFEHYNIFGSLAANSHRLKQMLDLGYTVVDEGDGWPNSYLKNTGRVLLVQLRSKEKVESAIEMLYAKCNAQKWNRFPDGIIRL
jgi:hypothetical protein